MFINSLKTSTSICLIKFSQQIPDCLYHDMRATCYNIPFFTNQNLKLTARLYKKICFFSPLFCDLLITHSNIIVLLKSDLRQSAILNNIIHFCIKHECTYKEINLVTLVPNRKWI
jgi:hypothetical protein